ncbi:MAG: DUF5615 family PIN-like protein [Nitrososphaeraceae archaeon]
MFQGTATNVESGLTFYNMKAAISLVRTAEQRYKVKLWLPRFLVDAMLGDIARKLRIFGFDTLYMKDTSDSSILEMALHENRILLTRDKEFFRRVVKAGAEGVLMERYDQIDNIANTLLKYGVRSLSFNTRTARCACCNGILALIKASDLEGAIPNKILEIHHNFFQCSNCNNIYWEGSHVKRLNLLAQKINTKIEKIETELANERFIL